MELFISGFLLSLSLCLELGLVNLAVTRIGVQHGYFPSFIMSIGSCFGDLIYAFIALFGIHLILDYIVFRWFLWIAGSFMLLYLSIDMIKKTFIPNQSQESLIEHRESNHTYFVRGFTLALSSPSAILWFASVGGSIIASTADNSTGSIIWFFSGFFLAGVVWSIILAFISSYIGDKMGAKIYRYFSFISAAIFLYFCVIVFTNGFSTLL
jgi:L-lysine exporter family protein LysE/ArgO